ncbi:alpha/beta fold hydrolase [Paludisphaera mucosa]|uniref:Alpha/beta fold hydrolase n=1 Tax=Paludisphaera mucosa TaxID=3030827 RepID=A0ABT6F6I5_9BACT|nr:alpha/beta fold hydrolase [Paludisphaera mucosa]MDG3003010.1 alpha/beta fold hydrolase [Paludisphaera mucosa]
MPSRVLDWIDLPRTLSRRMLRTPLILVNGLAEQSESWFANERHLARRFDLRLPEVLDYDGEALHRWIDAGHDVTIDFLARRLEAYLDESVQRPPCHLAASSLGCQVALTYAAANPAKVDRLVLICPSGLHGGENLPMIDGVRRSRYDDLVASVFHESGSAHGRLVGAFERKFQNRRWKKGVLKTLRGTVGHSVGHLLDRVDRPTLVIWGADDQILSDVPGSIRAASRIPGVRQVVVPRCGHAPQIEKSRLVNRLIDRFLKDRLGRTPKSMDPARFLESAARRDATSRHSSSTPLLSPSS